MDTRNAEDLNVAERPAARTGSRLTHEFWNEKPATKFCVGFVVFVVAEVIVYVTIHWLIPII